MEPADWSAAPPAVPTKEEKKELANSCTCSAECEASSRLAGLSREGPLPRQNRRPTTPLMRRNRLPRSGGANYAYL